MKGFEMSNRFLSRDKEAAIVNIKTYFQVTIWLAILASVLRSVAYLTVFDSEIGYFNEGILNTAVNALILLSCVFLLSGFIFISKEAKLPSAVDNGANSIFFSASFAGFIMLADFFYKMYNQLGGDKFEYYKYIFDPAYRAENSYLIRATAIIEIFGVLASVLSAICFFVRASKNPKEKLSAWLGFFPIVRALVGVAQIYFEMKVQMNHPSKLMLQFALISIMYYFLSEERMYVSKDHARPRRLFVSGCIAYFLAFTCGVSEIVGFFTGALAEGNFCVEAFFCLVVSIYILARTNAFVRAASALPCVEELTLEEAPIEEDSNEEVPSDETATEEQAEE